MKVIASVVLYKHSYSDIASTLDSLLNDSVIDKIILVDNGNHCEWTEQFVNNKVEVIKISSNKGFGAGHNEVFTKFINKAEYFLVCNPDVSFEKNQISKLYNFSVQNNIDFSIPKILYPDNSLQHSCKLLPGPLQLFMRRFCIKLSNNKNEKYELRFADYNFPFFAPSFSGCCLLIRNNVIKKIRGFDERFFLYMEDVDLSRRICSESFKSSYCPYSEVFHEAQRRSYLNVTYLFYHIVSAFKYFNKWGWLLDKERKSLNSKCLRQFL